MISVDIKHHVYLLTTVMFEILRTQVSQLPGDCDNPLVPPPPHVMLHENFMQSSNSMAKASSYIQL